MTCPKTFHLCPRSADRDGYSVVDRETGVETSARTDADARRMAEELYPGCEFALSTIWSIHGKAPAGTADAVIVAVLRRLDEGRAAVLAYVVSSVGSPSCVPFSPDVWCGALDHLPRDHRRKEIQ